MSVVNVGLRLSETARLNPNGIAIAMPRGRPVKLPEDWPTRYAHLMK